MLIDNHGLPDLVSNIYLTKREREILMLLGRGLNRYEVVQVLKITKNQLRVHIYNLKQKINDPFLL